MSEATTFAVRDQNKDQAIVLVHGFRGNSHETFGMLPAFLAGDPRLYEWDFHCFGYPTSLAPDISGVWTADPDLTVLAGYLSTAVRELSFKRYKKIALVAHSMGGLIVQRAVLDGNLADRISQTVLFGTPSNGLRKAGLLQLFKKQARDMLRGGEFVTKLRANWTDRFGAKPPFTFRAVAGIDDQFVPPESSVDPFDASLRAYVAGNHIEMVKPATASGEIAQILLSLIASPDGPGPVLPAVQQRQTLVDQMLPEWRTLGDREMRDLVFALEGLGRQAEAIEMLEEIHERSTDLTGILAGRLKRLWIADPKLHADAGVRAHNLYREAFSRAAGKADHAQAAYNGINSAFMTLALERDPVAARQIAATVLAHSFSAKQDIWSRATQGEAYLYLGDTKAALGAYAEAAQPGMDARDIDSLERQAIWAARLIESETTEAELKALFMNQRG